MFAKLKMAMPVWALFAACALRADGGEFDGLEPPLLKQLVEQARPQIDPKAADAVAIRHDRLTVAQLDRLPTPARESRSPILIVKTEQGGYCRILAVSARRRPPGTKGDGVPVLILERLDAFDSGAKQARRTATGRDLLAFDGFQVDLDAGAVVPEGQGGDIRFVVNRQKGEESALEPVGKTELYSIRKLPDLATAGRPRPSPGRKVIPSDFAGSYRLQANGQFAGRLTLEIGEESVVSGTFLSDKNGASYPVEGKVSSAFPHQIVFTITLPQTKQEFEGYLWTEGKSAMAGSFTLLERKFGFFAIREE